jgi:peptidoglycan biosynthesis protein MviN/MurJ (putative lipid II flippase)
MPKNPIFLSLSITGVNIFARVFHLLLFLLIGNLYGIGESADLVFLVYAPLSVIMSVVAGAADVIIMPGVHRAEKYNCVPGFLRAILIRALIFVLLATVAVGIASVLINPDILRASGVIALLLPIPFLACISSFSANFLNAHDKFRQAVLGPVFGTIGSVLVITLLPVSSTVLALALLSYEAGSAGGLWIIARPISARQGKGDCEQVREVTHWAMNGARMQVAGSLFAALNPMINIMFANSIGPGSVATVEYANRLWNFVPLLFSGSLMIFYSQRSRAESRQDERDSGNTHAVAIYLGVIALVFSLAVIFGSTDIINLIYGRGNMTAVDKSALAHLLSMYLLGSSAYIAGLVYVRAISALGKVYILTQAAALSVLLNLLFNLIMIHFFGLSGIGIAVSLTNIVISLFLFSRFVSQAR